MLQDHEITAWLGDAAEQLTPEQRAEFDHAVYEYEDQNAGRGGEPADYADDDSAVWSAILQTILGEDTLTDVGARYRTAKTEIRAWIIASALLGLPETRIAEQSTYTRQGVRKVLGK